MMILKKAIVGFSICLWWILACIAGSGLGLTLAFFIFTLMKSMSSGLSAQSFTYVAFPSVGLILGFFQSLIMRSYLLRAKRWILANTISYTLSVFLWMLLDPIFKSLVDYRAYIGFPVVVLASLFLWLVIRWQFARSLGWALVSGIGLITFFYAIQNVGYDLGHSSVQYIAGDSLTFAFSTGIPSGVVSGLAVVLLLGPILSRDSYLVEGLARLSEMNVYYKRAGIKVEDGPPSEPSFAKFIFVKMVVPILATGVLVLALTLTGP